MEKGGHISQTFCLIPNFVPAPLLQQNIVLIKEKLLKKTRKSPSKQFLLN